jgi:hypothetical protein
LDDSKTVREFLFDFPELDKNDVTPLYGGVGVSSYDTTEKREQEIELTIAINKLRITPYLDQIISSLS